MKERVQKLIASSGLCSRRAAEALIEEGRVSLNGQRVSLGERAGPGDLVEVDGKPLPTPVGRTYIMLNKPRGYVTTMDDEKGRKTVAMLVEGLEARVFPVGRLDMNSEGLLIMTDDGELANRLTHPSHRKLKTYEVRVRGEALSSALELLKQPMELDGVNVKAKTVSLLSGEGDSSGLVSITIGEGRNRQVRRMCEKAGLQVLRLKRVAEGGLSLGSLRPGTWRFLSPEEIDKLQN